MVWSNFIKFHQTHLWILRLLRTMGKATPGSIHSRCLPHLDNLAIWPPEKGKKPLLHSTATLQRARTTWFLVMGLSEGKVSENWWFISHSPYALRIQFFGGIPWHSNRPTYTVHQTSSDQQKNIRLHGFRSELRCATCAQHLAAFKVKPWNWGKHETTGISQTFKWDLKGYSQI